MTGRQSARAQLFGSAVAFGLMATLTRAASIGDAAFTAPQLTFVRFFVGALLTLALFALRPGTFKPVNRLLLATRGILGGVAVLCYFVALARIPTGQATFLNNTFPVFAVALSFFTLGERPTLHLGGALAVVSVGAVLMLGNGSFNVGVGVGELAGLASAILGAGAVTSIRRLRVTDNAPTIFFVFCVGGMVVSLPFVFGAWPHGARAWLLAGGVGTLSFVAQILMTEAYGLLTVAEAALWQQLTPVTSTLWAMMFLGEALAPIGFIGLLLGVIGVAYGTVMGNRATPVVAPN